MIRRPRSGMVLVATIAIVSLIAILAVATLSLTSRLKQGSSLSLRGARLDAAVAFGLGSVIPEWRPRSIGSSTVGGTLEFGIDVPAVPIAVRVTVTRLTTEIFWAVAEARAIDGSVRRENLILRLRMPNAVSVVAGDSSNVAQLGPIVIDSIAATADFTLPNGAIWSAANGVIHAEGDLTIDGGAAEGILIVEGKLTIVGALNYSGLIIARGGIHASGAGATLTGAYRVSAEPISLDGLTVNRSAIAVQAVLAKSLMPKPVAGRGWAEMY